MKTSLNHLPTDKQQELKKITEIICNIAKPEMIILFGSYARGDWVEEKYDQERYRYQSDFDILIIVKTRNETSQIKLEHQIEESLEQDSSLTTPISIILHDFYFVNRRLSKSQYFFLDIKKEGILLYDSGRFQFQEPSELSSEERYKIAKNDFEYWFSNARDCYDTFEFCIQKNKYNKSAFELHQTTEQLYSTILLVFTHYKPKTHDLAILRKFANTIDNQLGMVALNNKQNKHLFKLLRTAYVDARYKQKYVISPEELAKLSNYVNELKILVERLCLEKIESFTV